MERTASFSIRPSLNRKYPKLEKHDDEQRKKRSWRRLDKHKDEQRLQDKYQDGHKAKLEGICRDRTSSTMTLARKEPAILHRVIFGTAASVSAWAKSHTKTHVTLCGVGKRCVRTSQNNSKEETHHTV